MGGTLTVRSTLGAGSVFSCHLPVAYQQQLFVHETSGVLSNDTAERGV
jgi:hypothetical protein